MKEEKKDMEKEIDAFKARFDSIAVVPKESYKKLWPYLSWCTYKEGEIIKNPGDKECRARFMMQGYALFGIQKADGDKVARMLIFENELAFDPISFNSGFPSNYYLKAVTEVCTCELGRDFENIILANIPEFIDLSIKLNHTYQEKLLIWFVDNLSRPTTELYDWIMSLGKELSTRLQTQEIKGILGVSKSTMANLRRGKP